MRGFALALLVLVQAPIHIAAAPNASPYSSELQSERATIQERALSPYAPVKAACPSTPFVRPAGVSPDETAFVTARKSQASIALGNFLKKTNPGFGNISNYPTLGLTTSGGGFRSLLTGAGVHQSLDSRDGGNSSVAGLYQAMTYEGGLSGGGWLLGSISGNNWPTITSLKTELWESSFQNNVLLPDNLMASLAYAAITVDVLAKGAAGFSPTLTDPYGRLLGYALLHGLDGGVADTLSGLSSLSSFTSHSVPYPIITSIGVDTSNGQCVPGDNATQYELSPYSFGSWDQGVSAFAQTRYLGSTPGNCTTGYDNQGYVMGTTSNLFNEVCRALPSANDTTKLISQLEAILAKDHAVTTRDTFAVYPNPFQNNAASAAVSGQGELDLVDGGETNQNDPIWPFLYRNVDVLLVNDNSNDNANYPNGSELYDTYNRAQTRGLGRMPVIPEAGVFVAGGFDRRPKFFGCNDNSKMTIVYLPNKNYTFDSGQSTERLQYSSSDTDAMIANGNMVGQNGGDPMWATCLSCGIMKKTGAALPGACQGCFTTYCYN